MDKCVPNCGNWDAFMEKCLGEKGKNSARWDSNLDDDNNSPTPPNDTADSPATTPIRITLSLSTLYYLYALPPQAIRSDYTHRLCASGGTWLHATLTGGYTQQAGYTQRIRVGCAIADYAQHVGSRGNGADYTQ